MGVDTARVMRIAAALLGAVVLGVGGSALAGDSDRRRAPDTARLVVKGKFVDTGAHYIEGAFAYLVIRRRGAPRPVVRREYRGAIWLNKALPAGRYRLVSYVRPCGGICPDRKPRPCRESSCPGPGGLDRPTDRCADDFRLRSGQTLRAVVQSGVGIRCRIRFSAHLIAILGQTREDVALARDLRRYLRRNAGIASWYPAVRLIEARRMVLTVHTTLRATRGGRSAARQVCDLIQGADVADFTPGHTIRGRKEGRIVTCPARSE